MNKIMIFLGSGASVPFGIPTMMGKDGMSDKFESVKETHKQDKMA
jgi:NAD-dependent SIR2 family protein deacetylase